MLTPIIALVLAAAACAVGIVFFDPWSAVFLALAGLLIFLDDFPDEILCAPVVGRGWLRTVHSVRRS